MLYYALLCLEVKAIDAVKDFLHDEKGAVDIVAIVVLIGIAVVLAVIFRKEIEKLIKSLLGTINEKATEAVSE